LAGNLKTFHILILAKFLYQNFKRVDRNVQQILLTYMQFFHAAWPGKYRDGVEKVVEDKGQVPDCHASKANATCSPVGLVSVPSSLHAIPSHLISSHPRLLHITI